MAEIRQLVDDVLKKCSDLEVKAKTKCVKGKRYFLNIYHPSGLVIMCYLGKAISEQFFWVMVNPSKVRSFAKLEHALLQIIGEMIYLGNIYRLDFTVDYYNSYAEILEGLNVKYKHYRVEHLNSTKGRTGLQIGTDNDKVIIYDKAAQLGLTTPLTRIERQLSGPDVPVKTFKELRDSLPKILEFSPLSLVELHQFNLGNDKVFSASNVEKFYELKALIKHQGYFIARKKLYKNSNKNFQRDYGKFFNLTPLEIQPSLLLADAMTKYFDEVLQ